MTDARDPLADALREWLAMADNFDNDASDFRAILARHGLAVVPIVLLREAAEDIAGYVDAEYAVSTGGPHPAVARKYKRDMDVPRRLLAAAQEAQQ